LYIFFLVIVMLGELAAGILTLVYKDKVTKEAEGFLTTRIQKEYEGPEKKDAFSQAVDFAQLVGECCGVKDKGDYTTSNYTKTSGKKVPLSCCILKDPKSPPDAAKLQESDAETKYFKNAATCTASAAEDSTNKVGCKDALFKWFEERSVIIIGVGIGIACLELFGLIFAVCLCRNVGQDD